MDFISQVKFERKMKTEQEFVERSLGFLKKMYPLIKVFNYEIGKFSNEFVETVQAACCHDVDLVKAESEASKILFSLYTDEEIIEAIKIPFKQTSWGFFANCKGNPKKITEAKNFAEVIVGEMEWRRACVKNLVNMVNTDTYVFDVKSRYQRIIMNYHIDVMELAPYTSMLLLISALDKMKRNGEI